jgi:hypothetical protein
MGGKKKRKRDMAVQKKRKRTIVRERERREQKWSN